MCLLVGLLSEYYCWNGWPRQLKSHIPQPRSFTYEDSLSDQAAAAAAAAAFSFCLTQLSAYHITKQTSLATTMKGGLGGFTQAYFVINCEIFFLPSFLPSSHLRYLIFYTSSFRIHLSYFWSTSSPLPFLPLLASILVSILHPITCPLTSLLLALYPEPWTHSLFTLPDHSTDSHPWNDAIKGPTEAQSVMLTHAKPPQRAESR